MGMLIILVLLLVLSITLFVKSMYYSDFLSGVGVVFSIIFGIWIVIHLINWSVARYSYDCFVARRAAFEQTLHDSRANGNPYETATIVKDVSEWNENLAERKVDRNTFVYGCFQVQEIMDLKPIK